MALNLNTIACFIVFVVVLSGCDNSEKKSPEAASASFMEKCERRLENRKNLPQIKARQFCTCFLNEAGKKYTPIELDSRMDGSADDFFKSTVKAEVQYCQDTINGRP